MFEIIFVKKRLLGYISGVMYSGIDLINDVRLFIGRILKEYKVYL